VKVKTRIMLQIFSISKKCCSELSSKYPEKSVSVFTKILQNIDINIS